MQKESKIICPGCGIEIDVQNVLSHQLEDEIKKSYDAKLNAEKKKFEIQSSALELEKVAFEEKKKKENELFQTRLDARLKEEKILIESKIKAKIEEDQADQFKMLQNELNEKSDKLKEFNKSLAEIEKLKREKSELKETIEAEAQKTLNQKLAEEKDKIRKTEQD